MAITLEQKNELLAKYPGLELKDGIAPNGVRVSNTFIIVYKGTINPVDDDYNKIDTTCQWIKDNT
jgi:hypothetical protein